MINLDKKLNPFLFRKYFNNVVESVGVGTSSIKDLKRKKYIYLKEKEVEKKCKRETGRKREHEREIILFLFLKFRGVF